MDWIENRSFLWWLMSWMYICYVLEELCEFGNIVINKTEKSKLVDGKLCHLIKCMQMVCTIYYFMHLLCWPIKTTWKYLPSFHSHKQFTDSLSISHLSCFTQWFTLILMATITLSTSAANLTSSTDSLSFSRVHAF